MTASPSLLRLRPAFAETSVGSGVRRWSWQSVTHAQRLKRPRVANEPMKFAEALEDPGMKAAYLDRLGVLTAMAVVPIVVAYGYPIWQHVQMPRFGSPGFSPF